MIIPNQLREFRVRKGLRQLDVANELGFASTDRISRWEKGKTYPRMLNLLKLCIIYEAYPHELYEELLGKLRDDRISKKLGKVTILLELDNLLNLEVGMDLFHKSILFSICHLLPEFVFLQENLPVRIARVLWLF